MAGSTGCIHKPFLFINAALYMNMKKIIIVILAFISFRCGDDIPEGVIDAQNENLHITSLTVPMDSVYNNPNKPLFISLKVSNPQILKSAYYNLESPEGTEIFSNEALLDMENPETADTSTGDGIFSGRIYLDSTSSYGQYKLSIYLKTNHGEIIRGSINSFIFDNGKGNIPPFIENVIAPDTIVRPAEGQVPFFISVDVSDPDGLNNIKRVFFNSYGPIFDQKGILLNDKGENGDKVANDGTYSAGFNIKSENVLGRYRFEFIAQDKRGAESNIIDHYITITE